MLKWILKCLDAQKKVTKIKRVREKETRDYRIKCRMTFYYFQVHIVAHTGLLEHCLLRVWEGSGWWPLPRTPEDSDCTWNVLLESPGPLTNTWLWACVLSCTSHITATHLWQTSPALSDEGRHLTHNQRPGRKADIVAVNVPYASDEHDFGKLLFESPSQQFEVHMAATD